MEIYSITTAGFIPRVRFVAYHSVYLLLISINSHRPQQTISRLPERLANKEDFPVETFFFRNHIELCADDLCELHFSSARNKS